MFGALLGKLALGALCSMALVGLPGCRAQAATPKESPNEYMYNALRFFWS